MKRERVATPEELAEDRRRYLQAQDEASPLRKEPTMPEKTTTKEPPLTIQPDDPRWQDLQASDRRARRHDLAVTRGKNGVDEAQSTRLTVAQAEAYFASAMQEFEVALRSCRESLVGPRRLEVLAAVHDLVEAARFEQVILDLRASMEAIKQRTTVAPARGRTQHEPGGSDEP